MSEVSRYWVNSDGYLYGCSPAWEPKDDELVMWPDFKRMQDERDALQQRLNAADQQVDELNGQLAEHCEHEWTDDGEWTLICTNCNKIENHDPHGWVQTRGNAINAFTQEWDVVQGWEDEGFEYKAMYDRPELSGPEEPVEYGPTPGCKQCEEAERCGFTDCPECDAQLHEDVNGTGFQPGCEPDLNIGA